MTPVATFEFVLLTMVAVLGLELVAKATRLPPSAALLLGGIALAFVPGVPSITFDPDLVLLVFLPPLLMDGAYYTAWSDFRRELAGILGLAIGAVVFTTLAVGVVAHAIVPQLPWAAAFALGAVVSPPDAVAAKAVLEHVRLPRRVVVLLEGESLLNDAAGLVLFRFAVAAALTGAFSMGHAIVGFGALALGGVAVGALLGLAAVTLLRRLKDASLIVAGSLMLSWAAYVGAEALHVSGVIATVTTGLILGRHQHSIFSAEVRLNAAAFWKVLVFLGEAFIFVLIGLSLRGVILRLGGVGEAFSTLAPGVLAAIITVIVARFVWIFAVDAIRRLGSRMSNRRARLLSMPQSIVLGWAGMRGVVTLAIALSLPETMAGRDLVLATAFVVILVTVLGQGLTLGPLIRLFGLTDEGAGDLRHLPRHRAHAALASVQLAALQGLAYAPDGSCRHPRLLEQYGHRANLAALYAETPQDFEADKAEHYRILLHVIAAGRAEALRLHRVGAIHEETLHSLEHELDLQEVAAELARS